MKMLAVIGLVFLLTGCRGSHPLINVEKAGTGAPRGATLEQVERAIQLGAAHKKWTVRRIRPGLLEGQVQVRSHVAVVEIPFDTEQFSIIYKDSTNLKYDPDGPSIHSNYNAWVGNLKAAILRCASRIRVAESDEQLHLKPRLIRWACD